MRDWEKRELVEKELRSTMESCLHDADGIFCFDCAVEAAIDIYDTGYYYGYENGNSDGYSRGEEDGYGRGYDSGYEDGGLCSDCERD